MALSAQARLRAAAVLGEDYESALPSPARAAGAHYTPMDLACGLVAIATGGLCDPGAAGNEGDATAAAAPQGRPPRIWDPSCGGGAFLLAAAEWLKTSGHDPAQIVEELLWGNDIDPGAVAVTEAALVLWATLNGAPEARPGSNVDVGDTLIDPAPNPGSGFDLVIGNPPFQSQLTGSSVRSRSRRETLQARWGEVLGAYTDSSTLFLVAGVEALSEGGRLAMILPTSVLAARDAEAARIHVTESASLVGLWIAGEPVFSAAVQVCAPVLARHTGESGVKRSADDPVRRWRGRDFAEAEPAVVSVESASSATRWSALALGAHDVPIAAWCSAGRLGDVAVTASGFRDEYYGLVDHVVEDVSVASTTARGDVARCDEQVGVPSSHMRLITSGLIDVGECKWGQRPVRFAKQRFDRPVVDGGSLASSARADPRSVDARAWNWLRANAVPKLIVATQTRVGEAAVDEAGTWVPSTPTIAVRPNDPSSAVPGTTAVDRLWALAAVVCSPVGSIAALSATFGSGRSALAIRHTASSVADLPLPVDDSAWNSGAQALRVGDLELFASAMATAYALMPIEADRLSRWWFTQLPH